MMYLYVRFKIERDEARSQISYTFDVIGRV